MQTLPVDWLTCSSAASVHQIHLRAPTVNVKSPQNGNLLGSHIQQQTRRTVERWNRQTNGQTDRRANVQQTLSRILCHQSQ